MSEPIKKTIDAAQKVFEVNPRNFDTWDQSGPKGAARSNRKRSDSIARTPGATLEGALAEALRQPFSKPGNKEYITDVAAILRNYVFSEDPYHRYVAQKQYQALSPSQRQQVDALIVAANPNPQSARGVSPTAEELLHVLTGKRLSPERERAIADAAQFEGYSSDQQARDAAFSQLAPADTLPPGAEPDLIRGAIRERLRQQGITNPAALEKRVAEEYKRIAPRQRAIESEPEKRPRFLPRGPEEISVASEGLAAPVMSAEQRQAARQSFPAMYERQRQQLRELLQAESLNRQGEVKEGAKLPRVRLDSPEEIQSALITRRDSQRAQAMREIVGRTAELEGVDPVKIAEKTGISPADWPGLDRYRELMVNQKYPDYRTNPDLLARDTDAKYQVRRFLRSPEGIEQAVNRRLPPLDQMSPEQIDAKIDEVWQGYHEQANFGRSRSADRNDWSIPMDDSAAISAAEKQARGEPLSKGEQQALSGFDPPTSMTRRDRGEVAPSETYAQNFIKTLGFDPWETPDSFNSGPSRGRPGTKPDNIPGVGQNRTRQPSAEDSIGRDDSPAFDEAWDESAQSDLEGFASGSRLAQEEQADELAKMDGIETKPLKSRPGRGASAGRIKGLSKSSLENLYSEMLRAAGVEKNVKAGGGGSKAIKGAFLKPPAAHGFTDPDEMADFAIRVLDKDKPVPPAMRDMVKAELKNIFEERWGSDLGLSTLPSASGKPVGGTSTTDNLRARLEGRAPAPVATAPSPAAPAEVPAKPALDPNWNNADLQRKKRIEDAQKRAEELEKQVAGWPEGTESMELPPAADEIFGSEDFGQEDYASQFKALFGGEQQSVRPKPTQVGQPDADVVQSTAAGKQPVTDGRDPNDALLETEEAPAIPTSEELSSATMRGRLERKPQAPASPQPQAAGKPPAGRPPVQPRAAAAGGNDPLAQYIKDAAKNAQILATEKEGLPKFAGAMTYYNEARQQLQALMSDPKAKPIADRLAAEVIGPMDAAIQKRFPKGVPSHLSPSATPAPSAKPAAQAAPKGAPAGDLQPGPSKPIDPLDSASKTEVGEDEGLALPNPNAGAAVTPPPVPATRPTPLKDLQQEYARLNRGIREFRARTGRSPTQAEIEDIRQALASGGEIGSPIQDFSVSPEDFKEGNFGQYIRNRLAGMRGAQDEANRRVADARALDEARTGKFFGDSGEDLEELPVPGARAAAESEQAARNVDAAKATKDAESDKATAVSAKAASDADAEAAAKRTEDATNTNTAPQPQKAGQSGKQPSEPGFLAREFNRFQQQGSLYPITAGFRAGAGAIRQGMKWGPLAALGGYGLYSARDYIKQALPEDYHDEVDAGARMLEQAGGAAAGIAGRMFGGQGGGSGPGGSAPGGQGPGIIPVSMPGEGPIQGEEGINMVPQGLPPGYQTQDSLERIRRIISATQPQSRYQPGTAQRPTAY